MIRSTARLAVLILGRKAVLGLVHVFEYDYVITFAA